MKIRRHKKVSKVLNFYKNNFGFREPYQILVDGTFCLAALKNQVNIVDNVARYLHGDIKLLSTACAIIEIETLGPKLTPALTILKQYAVHSCGHEKRPISAANCLLSMVGTANQMHYIVATQDRQLQRHIRAMNAAPVPLLYLHGKTPTLETPTDKTAQLTSQTISVDADQQLAIDKLKAECGLQKLEVPIKRRRRAKGPNPLSCKKSKKTQNTSNCSRKQNSSDKNRNASTSKKGRKLRISKHIKEVLFNTKL